MTDDACSPEVNLMPAIVEAARARATVGEMVGALADVFGTWVESPRL
jgi:methylmalonyl-CoA mutase N-terminal domain/subunit